MGADGEVIGYWTAGVLYEVGGIEWLRNGQTYKAGSKSWVRRATAAAKAVEMLAQRAERYQSWRPGRRDSTQPRKPIAAVVGSPRNLIELANTPKADASSLGCDFWWAVLKPTAFGMHVRSLHGQRVEAESLAAQSGCVLGIASTSGVIGYSADRLLAEAVASEGR